MFYHSVLPDFLKAQICKDIKEAIEKGRAGADMDIKVWQSVLERYEDS